ncbi:tRNA (adenosine(37)-N6)-threonylcarbamoyltransferase complex dimerization subunit type 1 TsaB [Pigmentiphaga litoralis]|uniref:tRNA (adenosine(37)-N6)-threonylcarbamoyltransferase complex dimerization subunit type 1 TsaB n=1 Tax=Pigmentiphaga litoralis TaxID=516702 RepID=UPI003B428CBE
MSLHILSLETSSAWCGVALLRGLVDASSPVALISREHQGVQEHSARLLPMIDEVLAEAGIARSAIDAIAFGQGPGGFTGLRVACGVAQGLGFALDRPVLPVVSHAAVAVQAQGTAGQPIVVAMDARMQEVYVAAYAQPSGGEQQVLLAPQLMALEGLDEWLGQTFGQTPGTLPRGVPDAGDAIGDAIVADAEPASTGWWLAGDAAAAYPDAFAGVAAAQHVPDAVRPTASAVAMLARRAWLRGEAIAPELAMPLYVRDKVAFTTAERLLGAGGNPKVAPAAPVGEGA